MCLALWCPLRFLHIRWGPEPTTGTEGSTDTHTRCSTTHSSDSAALISLTPDRSWRFLQIPRRIGPTTVTVSMGGFGHWSLVIHSLIWSMELQVRFLMSSARHCSSSYHFCPAWSSQVASHHPSSIRWRPYRHDLVIKVHNRVCSHMENHGVML